MRSKKVNTCKHVLRFDGLLSWSKDNKFRPLKKRVFVTCLNGCGVHGSAKLMTKKEHRDFYKKFFGVG